MVRNPPIFQKFVRHKIIYRVRIARGAILQAVCDLPYSLI